MPFYSAYTASGYLVNKLSSILDSRELSSFGLSKVANLSPTTTRKIYVDSGYIPSPDVLEKLCIALNCIPGDLLDIQGSMGTTVAACSGVF